MRSKNKYPQKCFLLDGKPFRLLLCFAVLLFSCSTPIVDKIAVTDVDSSILKLLAQSPGHTVLSRQTVVRFGKSQQNDSITSNGIIVPDERRTNKIAMRFGGRVEKLYVRYPFQHVNKGEKLLDLYSPELNTSISEYLFLLGKDKSSTLLVQARKKLELFGLSDSQISGFEKNGTPPASISIYSPYDGFVISSESTMSSTNSMQENSSVGMSGMNASADKNQNNNTTISSSIREGSYVSAGQTVFTINDAHEVIALLSIDPVMQTSMKTGIPVNIVSELLPEKIMNGTIDLIEPAFQNGQRFLSVRIPLNNSDGLLKFNSLVKAEIKLSARSNYTLPSSCIFDLGNRKIVWIKSGEINHVSVFIPRVIIVGSDDAGYTEILSGLKPGEEVALDAGFLVDREGIIQAELP